MTQPLSRRGAFAAIAVLLTSGAAMAQEGIMIAPPPPRREVRPPRPGERMVWQPGYWRWEGGRHVWQEGVWVERPHARAAWIAGHWAHRPRGWFWIPGHWA